VPLNPAPPSQLDAPRTDCPASLPVPPPLPASQLAAEAAKPLNDHHVDSLNILCALLLLQDEGKAEGGKAVSSAPHPVCKGYAGVKGAATVRRLEKRAAAEAAAPAPAATAAAVWASTWPHLDSRVAALLRQRDFEGISRSLFAAYRRKVAAAAEEEEQGAQ
jgi:hypothetical protein